MIKKFILLYLLMSFGISYAEPLNDYVDSLYEQNKAAAWITDNNEKLTDNKALAITRDVYAHSFSKSLNPHLVLAIIRVESNFQENARSSYGAKGIMQVVPRFHKDKLVGRNPYNTYVSTEVGTTILEDCNRKSKGKLFKTLQCYSGGGGIKYLKKVQKYQYELAQSLKPRDTQLAMK